jgi:lambda repressor-like predicted transcriptional regulator
MADMDFIMLHRNWAMPTTQTYTEFSMELKAILKKLIKIKGISVAHLSRETKVPLPTLHGWLQGTEPKSLRQVKIVADYLGVDLDYLCFGVRTKPELEDFQDEINAGIFEVVLRRVKR